MVGPNCGCAGEPLRAWSWYFGGNSGSGEAWPHRVKGIEITPATDAIMQTHIIGSRPAIGSRTLPRSDTLAAAVFAALLGVFVIWAVAFSDIAHNVAHDTRHSAGFPCH
jgi:cobalt transporter subunit CbtB